MPTKRTCIPRPLQNRMSDEVLEAYQAGDYRRLHTALHLPPWHLSPLPLDQSPLGVDPDDRPDAHDITAGARSWSDAMAWQEAIKEALAC